MKEAKEGGMMRGRRDDCDGRERMRREGAMMWVSGRVMETKCVRTGSFRYGGMPGFEDGICFRGRF